jgi:hypothetical protein
VGFAWWVLAFFAVVGILPVWMLIEMDGFGEVQSISDRHEEEGEDEQLTNIAKTDKTCSVITSLELFEDEDGNEATVVDGPSLRKETSILKPSRSLSNPIGMSGECFGPDASTKLGSDSVIK